MRCDQCRFWEPIANDLGGCRRYPAEVKTADNDWCGEFAAKDGGKKSPLPATEVLKSLDAAEINQRIEAINKEREALLILHRAAIWRPHDA